MKPIAAFAFGTTWLSLFALGIRYAQHGKSPFHVGVYFIMDDGGQVGFESSYRDGGWIMFDYAEKVSVYNLDITKTIREIPLPLSGNQIETLYVEAKRMRISVTKYPSKLTMLSKLLHQRLGWRMFRTPNIDDCSEGLARLMAKVGIDLTDAENPIADELSPSEVWGKLQRVTVGA